MRIAILWLLLIIPSALWGSFCAYKIKTKYRAFLSAFIPWLVVLIVIVFTVYFISKIEEGANMWPFAQLIGGTVAAVFGYFGYKFSLLYLINKK